MWSKLAVISENSLHTHNGNCPSGCCPRVSSLLLFPSSTISLHYRVCVLHHFSYVWLFVTLWTVAHQALCPWDYPAKNTGVGCHFLLRGIVLIEGLNPSPLCLLHWLLQVASSPLAPPGKPPLLLLCNLIPSASYIFKCKSDHATPLIASALLKQMFWDLTMVVSDLWDAFF